MCLTHQVVSGENVKRCNPTTVLEWLTSSRPKPNLAGHGHQDGAEAEEGEDQGHVNDVFLAGSLQTTLAVRHVGKGHLQMADL